MNKHYSRAILVASILATGQAAAQSAVQAPIDAAQVWPLVNGAVYEYRNNNVVSSSSARMTVTNAVTLAGQVATEVNLTVSCDKTAGKEYWNSDTFNKVFGVCRSRKMYLVQGSDGLRELGDIIDNRDYAYRSTSLGNQAYLRTSTYVTSAPPLLKNGYLPGTFVYNAGVPGAIPPSWVNSKPGESWGAATSQTATFSAFYEPRTRSGYESRRDVAIWPSVDTPAGTFRRTLHVEDAILDVGNGFAPNQTRYQMWQYAKGLGPVLIRTGDAAYGATISELSLTTTGTNITGYGNVATAMEEFHLVRHNLPGCPGYDATMPPLPTNSGNICASVYGSDPSLGAKQMVEYFNAAFNYYFMTSRKDEQDLLDKTPAAGFVRTGQFFYVAGAPGTGLSGVTRFFFSQIAKGGTRGSHFYTVFDSDVQALTALNPNNATTPRLPVSEGVDSYVYQPTLASGRGVACAAGQVPVYRMFRGNARFPDDPNHRFTTDAATRDQFVAQGWDDEGIAFCALSAP